MMNHAAVLLFCQKCKTKSTLSKENSPPRQSANAPYKARYATYVFDQFKDNPEEFIIKAAALINDEKATAIIQHITYDVLDDHYGTEVFTDPTIKGKLATNAMKARKHLYDHILYDSTNERGFATELDTNTDVTVYVKLPDGFCISTPVGHYNPDWAIAFYEGKVKHIYFVAETKGSMSLPSFCFSAVQDVL